MITYPLRDLEIGNDKVKKTYDLYGVVNHFGSLEFGHYIAYIKKNDKWIKCNDSEVTIIDEKQVMNSNAYILFYICKEQPSQNDYFKLMLSIMNKINKKEEKTIFENDRNFFKGEPVKTKYGEGYIIKENLIDFKYDDKFNKEYDIYTDLIKEDLFTTENLNKKEEKNIKEEKKDDKKNDKKERKNENEQKDKKIGERIGEKNEGIKDLKNEENKEGQKEDKNGEKNEEIKEEEEKDNINEIKNEVLINIENKQIIENNQILENKEKIENKEQINLEDNKGLINENDNEEKKIIEKDVEKNGDIFLENNNNKIIEEKNNEPLPNYYNNLVEIKFEYGKAFVHRNNVTKYIQLYKKEEEMNKTK